MIDWNGFDKGVIGRKLPSDKTLNNMRKADLIEYLHIADKNHNVLAFAYRNAVDNSKCNRCPIPKMSTEHDKQIRAEVFKELAPLFEDIVTMDNICEALDGEWCEKNCGNTDKCLAKYVEQLKEQK